jgi:hypothetical protein
MRRIASELTCRLLNSMFHVEHLAARTASSLLTAETGKDLLKAKSCELLGVADRWLLADSSAYRLLITLFRRRADISLFFRSHQQKTLQRLWYRDRLTPLPVWRLPRLCDVAPPDP